MEILKYYKINDTVVDPIFKTKGSACFDLPIHLESKNIKCWETLNNDVNPLEHIRPIEYGVVNNILIEPDVTYLIPTGIIFEIPEGYHIQIHLRSSTGLKKHLAIPSHIGIIDSDYRDQVHVPLMITTHAKVRVYSGDMLAQAMLVSNEEYLLRPTNICPPKVESRNGGFGSTGN